MLSFYLQTNFLKYLIIQIKYLQGAPFIIVKFCLQILLLQIQQVPL